MSVVDKVANVVGAKTARPCDGCIRKRARWFCAADDAFLCQSCDSRVHPANPLARRHERVRLKTASFGSQRGADNVNKSEAPRPSRVPSWRSRKARTQRGKQQCSSSSKSPTSDDIVKNLFYLVPEDDVSDETKSFDEIDGLLLYGRVPIFDSFMVDMCTSPRRANKSADGGNPCFGANEMKGFVGSFYNEVGFVPSEMDSEEFAADVESMLGKVLDDDESFGIDGLGLIMDDTVSTRCGGRVIKDEDEETKAEEIEMANDAFHNLSFDYDEDCSDEKAVMKKRKIMLSLDYESILSAWDGPSPWASGTVPEVDPTECWPACLDTCEIESHQQHLVDHPVCINGGTGLSGDERRKARVSRYREKRRTRLFSKKIRYEVRKLNAEKRPRMKGRFVKRPLSSFPPTSSVSLFS